MNPDLVNSNVAFVEILGRDPLELWLLGVLTAVMLAALGRAAWTRRAMRTQSQAIDPYLVFPESTVRRPMTPSPFQGLAWAPPISDQEDDEEEAMVRADFLTAGPVPQFRPAPIQPATAFAPAAQRPSPLPTSSAIATNGASTITSRPAWTAAPARPSEHVDLASETIRLPTAADGTVQLLPGMLMMVQGPEVGHEYRFLRVGNQAVPEVTIGRANGPAYRHIHLPAATVSRMHARIRYEDRSWRIANLSTTNPLLLNGHEIRATEEIALKDGDRIQLGEVELGYSDKRL